MEENKGPFYSYNFSSRTINLHNICQECECLKTISIANGEYECEHDACPKLGDIRKGA